MLSSRAVAAKIAGQARWRQGGAEHLGQIRAKSPGHDPDLVARRHYMTRLALRRWHREKVSA